MNKRIRKKKEKQRQEILQRWGKTFFEFILKEATRNPPPATFWH